MNLIGGGRLSRVARRWLLVAALLLLLVAGMVVLALWATPPQWLVEPSRVTLSGLGWARRNVLTVAVAGLLLSALGLVLPFAMRRLERRDAADERRRARDRHIMLKRVRNGWITGVLEQSLVHAVRLRLGLTRRLDAIQQRDLLLRRPGGHSELLPAGTSLTEVFDELDGGLLILGAPGSGKTTALLELARNLLKQAEADERQPMPVVFNLPSWATQRPAVDQWLIDELRTRYDIPLATAKQWVGGGEILPLLDGLDEVAKTSRAECVEAINAFHSQHGTVRFVVCSRSQDYEALGTLLQVQEAVELQPSSRQQIAEYLQATGGALGDVQAALEADETLWELLSSPLVLNVIALTYQDRSAEALRAPGSPTQRLRLLFAAYTERMLAHRPGRYNPTDTLRWLAWLACTMREHSQSEFHLDRLGPEWLPTKTQQRLVTLTPQLFGGLAGGLAGGLVLGMFDGLTGGLAGGLVVGLVVVLADVLAGVLAGGRGRMDPVEEVHWSWSSLRAGLALGVVVGLAEERSTPNEGIHRSARHALALGLVFGLIFGLIFGLATGLVGGLVGGLEGGLVVGLAEERSTPNEGIHRSARHALAFGLVFGLIFGLVGGLIFGLLFGLATGLVVGLVFGLGYGGRACLQHLVLRGLLAYHRFAPLRYVRFLDEATERLFLRRAGSGYIFAHRLLLDYFADLDTTHPPAGAERPVALSG